MALDHVSPSMPQLTQQEFAASLVLLSGRSVNIDTAMFPSNFMQSHWERSEQPDARKVVQLVKMDCGACCLSRPDVELLCVVNSAYNISNCSVRKPL